MSYGLCDSLALDLLIYNFKFQKVANLDLRYLYPVACKAHTSKFDLTRNIVNLKEINGGIALPCEVYEKDKYVILQIRSPIIPVESLIKRTINKFIGQNKRISYTA